MTTNQTKTNVLPAMAELCLNVPLYHPFPVDGSTNTKELDEVILYKGNIDCYCMECGKSSVFQINTSNVPSWKQEDDDYSNQTNHRFHRVFSCTRNREHELTFYFRIHDHTITKIGQYPSLADLASVEIQKYRKILGSQYAEFNRAVGLASHGIGIGAFVYLRRIFEHLIEEAHRLEMGSSGWDEELYQTSRIDERILLLKRSLPEFLVENKSLYGILSKGIHELSEDECLGAFPVTKLGIELILDERLEKLQRQDKIRQATKEISRLGQSLKRSST